VDVVRLEVGDHRDGRQLQADRGAEEADGIHRPRLALGPLFAEADRMQGEARQGAKEEADLIDRLAQEIGRRSCLGGMLSHVAMMSAIKTPVESRLAGPRAVPGLNVTISRGRRAT
jgi:hypothetical protein